APSLHLAMKHAIKPRRDIGLRTIFNLLGPLTNPAGASRQVLGVYAPELTELIARVLLNLGSENAFVVYGMEGIDEISICGETRITHLEARRIRTYYLKPEDLGLKRAGKKEIQGGDAARNVEISLSVLRGEKGPCRDVVLLNTAAALVAGGKVEDLQEGVFQAQESIDKGYALDKLESLREFSRRPLCS
ncbi:MAG: anthranilate phosphoribosyltransferase, partial [Candidatus Syntrophonatronum acetioxidans]